MRKIWIPLVFILVIFFGYLYLLPPGHTKEIPSAWLQTQNTKDFLFKGSRIQYLEAGSGPPLLLLHGGGTWSYTFRNNIPELAKEFTVYSIDFPGHGFSEIPKDFLYTLPDIAQLIDVFLEKEHIEKVSLAGNSWGGGWALYFAQTRPSRVDNLVLVDAAGLKNTTDMDQSEWPWLVYPVLNQIIIHFVTESSVRDGYKDKLFFDPTKVTEDVVQEVFGPLTLTRNLKAQIQYQRKLDWKLTDQMLGDIKIPTLIIWGRQDQYLDVKMAREMHERIPNSQLRIIEHVSHLPHEELPHAFNRLVIQFIEKKSIE